MRSDEDFPAIVAMILVGMAMPVVLAIRFHDLLALYSTGDEFTLLAAAAYGLAVWLLVARYDLDRVNIVFASFVIPVVGVLVILFVGLSMHELHDGFRYLFLEIEELFTYAAAFGIAGITAVGLQRKTEQLADRYEPLPTPATIPFLLLTIIVLGALAVGAIGHATASTAEVTAVAPAATAHGSPVLNVTVESDPTNLHLTITAPDESTTTHRLTPTDLENGTATVSIRFSEFGHPEPQAGTYTVTVTGVPGLTVDRATHTIETTPTPSLVDTATAPGGEALDLDLPADAIVYGPKHDTETRVAVVLQNEGDVAGRFFVRLFTENDRLASRDIPLEPGQQGANVFELSEEDVDRVHADADGTVSIEIAYGDERIRAEVELPEP